VTWRLTVTRADASGRLRVGRLGLAGPTRGADVRLLFPTRWPHGLVVLCGKPSRTPEPAPPVPLTADARLLLPKQLRIALDVPRQHIVAASDGTELWLLTAAHLTERLHDAPPAVTE